MAHKEYNSRDLGCRDKQPGIPDISFSVNNTAEISGNVKKSEMEFAIDNKEVTSEGLGQDGSKIAEKDSFSEKRNGDEPGGVQKETDGKDNDKAVLDDQEYLQEEIGVLDMDEAVFEPPEQILTNELVDSSDSEVFENDQEIVPLAFNAIEDDDDDGEEILFSPYDYERIDYIRSWVAQFHQNPEILVPKYHQLTGAKKERCKHLIRQMVKVVYDRYHG